jgi:hypothetical protein
LPRYKARFLRQRWETKLRRRLDSVSQKLAFEARTGPGVDDGHQGVDEKNADTRQQQDPQGIAE